MGVSEYSIDIRRVRQNRWNYCGPACLAMIQAPYGLVASQDDIWDATRNFMVDTDNWYTDPVAMERYLSEQSEISQTLSVDDLSFSGATDALKKMIRTVSHYQHAAAMLVDNGMHWVVMRGVKAEFSDVSLKSCTATSLLVENPARGLGSSDTVIYPLNSAFFDEVFTPVKIQGEWHGKIVTVVEDSEDTLSDLQFLERNRPAAGGVDLLSEDVPDLVHEDINYFGLGSSNRLLGGGIPGGPSAAFEVKNALTNEKRYYYYIELDGNLALAKFSVRNVSLVEIVSGIDGIWVPSLEDNVRAIITRFGSLSGVELDETLYHMPNARFGANDLIYRRFSVDGEGFVIDGRNQIEAGTSIEKAKAG